MRVAIVLSLFAAACSFKGGFDGTHYKCGAGDTCPNGQACVAGECVAGPNTPDAPAGSADARADASPGTPDAMTASVACGSLGDLADGFDSNTIGTWWDAWSDGAPTTTITNSRLVIALPGGAQGGNGPWAGIGSTFMYDFAGSVFQVTVSQVGGTDTLIEVRGASNEKAQMVVENGTLYAGVYGNVPSPGTRASLAYDPTMHKKWRIRESGGVTYWEWSTDGTTWTELWHEQNPFVGDDVHHVWGLLSAGGQQTSATEAHFENVNVNLSVPGLCAASTWQDDFTTSSFGPGWNWWNDPHTTMTSTGGAAVMTTDGTASDYAGYQTWHVYDLRGDTYYADPSQVPQQTGFVTWMQAMAPGGGGNTMLEFNMENTTLHLDQSVKNSETDSQNVTYDPVAMKYWRFRADAAGTNVYLETSPDASTWTTRLTAPARFDVSHVFFVHGAGAYQTVPAETQKTGSVNVP